jgi:hypothetical protein
MCKRSLDLLLSCLSGPLGVGYRRNMSTQNSK